MPFFNLPMNKKSLAFVTLLVLLGGCATTDKKATDDTAESVEAKSSQTFIVLPSPYQPGEVPIPAKNEYAKIKALMEAKKWEQAKGLLDLMIATYPTLSGPYINLGIAHHELGELDAAERALQFAIQTNALNFDAYTRLGLLYREQGRFTDAEKIYLEALSHWPHHLPSVTNLGIIYDLYMGRFDEALKYYELALNIAGGEDRQIQGWIIDLKRRAPAP